MKINQTRELLYDYARGELSDQEKVLVEKLLNNSEELRKELKNVHLYYEMIVSVEPVSVPENFLDKVHSRIRSQQKKAWFSWLQLPSPIKLPMELAGILATVVLVVFIFIPELGKKNFSGYEPISSESETPSITSNPIEPELNEKKHTDENGSKGEQFDNENTNEKQSIESAKKSIIAPKEEVRKTKPALRSSPENHPAAPLISVHEHKKDIYAGTIAEQPPAAEASIPATAPASPNVPEPEQRAQKQETVKEEAPTSAPLPAVALSSEFVAEKKLTDEINTESENVSPQAERQMTVKDEDQMRTNEIRRKIVELESKRAKLRSLPLSKSSSSDEALYKSRSVKEDASDVYVDAEALMMKYELKWTVKESLPGTKIYSARGTPKSVDRFLKEIKGKLNVNLIRIIPEDYSRAVESVIVEFKTYKR